MFTVAKFAASFLAIFLLNSSAFASSLFSDVNSGDWYYDYVETLVFEGIVDGDKINFDPSANVTRDVAAKVVLMAAGYSEDDLLTPEKPFFKDVPKSAWSYSYIETARSLGFVSGYSHDTYAPGAEVSRAEFAAMIMRTFELEKKTSKELYFFDVKSTDWFYEPVVVAYQWSIINGYKDGFFKPLNSINRAEMAKMIVLAMSIEVEEDSDDDDDEEEEDDEPVSDLFTDDFSEYSSAYYEDGKKFGEWLLEFAGYGTVGIENEELHLSPKVADSGDKTHASLVTGPEFSGTLNFQAKIYTEEQLRTGSTPNAWEVAWMVWNYSDNDHFYYFIPKPNGWELGKRDPSYPGGQRFLATGSDIVFPINKWYEVKIKQELNTIQVWVNGAKITSFTDNENPYTSGNIGFYTEDAHVHVDDVSAE